MRVSRRSFGCVPAARTPVSQLCRKGPAAGSSSFPPGKQNASRAHRPLFPPGRPAETLAGDISRNGRDCCRKRMSGPRNAEKKILPIDKNKNSMGMIAQTHRVFDVSLTWRKPVFPNTSLWLAARRGRPFQFRDPCENQALPAQPNRLIFSTHFSLMAFAPGASSLRGSKPLPC